MFFPCFPLFLQESSWTAALKNWTLGLSYVLAERASLEGEVLQCTCKYVGTNNLCWLQGPVVKMYIYYVYGFLKKKLYILFLIPCIYLCIAPFYVSSLFPIHYFSYGRPLPLGAGAIFVMFFSANPDMDDF